MTERDAENQECPAMGPSPAYNIVMRELSSNRLWEIIGEAIDTLTGRIEGQVCVIEELHRRCDNERISADHLRVRVRHLRADIAALTKRCEVQDAALDGFARQVDALNEANIRLEAENAKLKGELERLKEAYGAVRENYKKALADNITLRADLARKDEALRLVAADMGEKAKPGWRYSISSTTARACQAALSPERGYCPNMKSGN